VLARFEVTSLDATAQVLLLLGGEEVDLVDLLEIGLETAFGRNGGPPWSEEVKGACG